jgi:precorrin-4 methylase
VMSFYHSVSMRVDAAQIVADWRNNLQKKGMASRIQSGEPSLYGSWGTAWRQNSQA